MHPALRLNLVIVFIVMVNRPLKAQQIKGIYRMAGGHEMVAAFEFKKDSSYQFYFIYGSVDRNSNGRFTIQNGNIILHSVKVPGNDFTIIRQEKRGDGTSIKITNPNVHLIKNVAGIFKKGNEEDQQISDAEGNMHTQLNDCDSIFVMHMLFPDIPTLIKKDQTGRNNYFELGLNPSLAGLSFQDFILSITPEGLTGSLPWLFEREKAVFVKESE